MELRDLFMILRRRAGVIVLVTIIVAAAAVIMSLLQPKLYQSRSVVLVNERDAGSALLGSALSDLSNPQRGLDTQVEVMQQEPIAEVAIRKLSLPMTADELLRKVRVSAMGQTNMVQITVTDGSPQRAAQIANALAQAYVDWSRLTRRASIRAAGDQIESRLNDAQAQIIAIGRSMARTEKKDRNGQPIKDDRLSAQLSIATGLYTTLAQKLEELRANEQLETGSGQIVTPAQPNLNKVSPLLGHNLALAILVGLGFGLGVAFLVEYLDNSVRSRAEAETLYGAPVLGDIPTEKTKRGERGLTITERTPSSTAEAYRVLRNSLDYINFKKDTKSLLVTSAEPSEGKSTVAANLAAGLAQTGKRVVLICTDFRRSTARQFFNTQSYPGLSDVLTGRAALAAALQTTELPTLSVLEPGEMPPNPSELLGSEQMHYVITECENVADWVIVDSPPVLVVADPASVSRWVDGVLVVMRAGTSTREAARRTRELLENVGARIAGVVVWDLRTTNETGRHGHYYGKYEGYYAPADDPTAESGGTPGTRRELLLAKYARGARRLGRIALAVLAVLVVVAAALFFLDRFLGWGLLDSVLSIVR